jgi:hypothetical protein
MGGLRVSIRTLMFLVAFVGLDTVAIRRFARRAFAGHAGIEVVIGFGLVLLVLNFVILGLVTALSKKVRVADGGVANIPPTSLMIVGFYATLLAVAILSFLFLALELA